MGGGEVEVTAVSEGPAAARVTEVFELKVLVGEGLFAHYELLGCVTRPQAEGLFAALGHALSEAESK